MAKQLLNSVEIDACHNEAAGKRMPQVVPAKIFELGIFDVRLPFPGEVGQMKALIRPGG